MAQRQKRLTIHVYGDDTMTDMLLTDNIVIHLPAYEKPLFSKQRSPSFEFPSLTMAYPTDSTTPSDDSRSKPTVVSKILYQLLRSKEAADPLTRDLTDTQRKVLRQLRDWSADTSTANKLNECFKLRIDEAADFDDWVDNGDHRTGTLIVDQELLTGYLAHLADNTEYTPRAGWILGTVVSAFVAVGAPTALVLTAMFTTVFANTPGLSGILSSTAGIAVLVVTALLTAAAAAGVGTSAHSLRFPKRSSAGLLANWPAPSQAGADGSSGSTPASMPD